MVKVTLPPAETGLDDDLHYDDPNLFQVNPWLCWHPWENRNSYDRAACVAGHITQPFRNLGHL